MTVPIATITAPGGRLTADSTLTVGPITVPVPERTATGITTPDRRIAEAARTAGYERTNGDWYTEDDVITVGVIRRQLVPGEPVIVLDGHGQPDGSGRFSAELVDGRFVIMVGGSRRDVHAVRLPRQGDAEWGIRDAVTSVWVVRGLYSQAEATAQLALVAERLSADSARMLRVAPVADGTLPGHQLAALEREVAGLRDGLVDVATIAAAALVDDEVSRQQALERVAERVTAVLASGG